MATLPAIDLSYGSDITKKYNVRRKRMGDNYTLRAGNGVNLIKQEWRLVWENISEADKDTLVDFFDDHYGVVAFEWTPFGQDTELKFITSTEVSFRPSKGPLWTVSVDIEQVFDA